MTERAGFVGLEAWASRQSWSPLRRALTLLVAAIGVLAVTAGEARADDPVNSFYGTFGTQVAIDVPQFFGLQPALSLTYGSSVGNGFVGVGWYLSGFSSIERTSPGNGAPAYGSGDVFVVDGEALTPDTSMGCQYSTRIKNYACISFNASTNTWTALGTNGARATYSPTYATALGTFRWGLTSLADTHGNTVHYGWWCDAGANGYSNDCYPSSVSYDGTVITMSRAPRPDPVPFADGSSLGQTNYRLDSIDVQVGGVRARSYQVVYATSGSTSRSIVTSVQQFGDDAVLDGSGTVTGGTALPPMTLSTASESQTNGFAAPAAWQSYVPIDSWSEFWQGDFNGDGKADAMWITPDNQDMVMLSTGSGFAAPVVWSPGPLTPAPSASGTIQDNIAGGYALTGLTASGSTITGTAYTGRYTETIPGSITLGNCQASGSINPSSVTPLSRLSASGNTITGYSWSGRAWTPLGTITLSNCGASGDINDPSTYGNIDELTASGNTITASEFSGRYWTALSGSITFSPLTVGEETDSYSEFWPGDFDGDGKTDVLFLSTVEQSHQYMVMRSTGSAFAAPVAWAPYAAVNSWSQFWLRDLNADGKTDILYLDAGSPHHYMVMLSTGSGFAAPVSWATYVGINSWSQFWLGDFNGDGKPDILYLSAATPHQYVVMLNTGSGFAAPVSWAEYTAINSWSQFWLGDYNGDGKVDLLYLSSASPLQYTVMLSTGSGFAAPVSWAPYIGINSWSQFWLGDFNGDSKMDLMYLSAAAPHQYMVMLSTGNGFAAPVSWAAFGSDVNSWSQFWVNDFDGDGKSDALYLGTGPLTYTVMRSAAPSDLVTRVSNGLGGQTTVAYEPSSAWSNTYLPGGMVFPTVSSVTTSDGRGASSTSSFQYQGGLWSMTERRFLGFRYVKSVIDAAGDYSEVYYHQHVGCIAKPDAQYLRDASGNIFNYSTYDYTENDGAPPYTSLLTDRWTYQCDEGSSCRRTYDQYAYDQYSNLTGEYRWGDYDLAGDESVVLRGYSPNTASYIVGLVAYENTYTAMNAGGVLQPGTLLAQTLSLYDGASSYSTAPTVGNLTMQERWNSQTGGYQTAAFAYDPYGNRVAQTDALGRTSSTGYDATYHVYPVQACDALSHCSSQVWNPVLGVATSLTDPNGARTSNAYDVFGRLVSQTAPDGSQTIKSYVGWGNASAQYVQTTAPNGVSSQTWFDGAKRTYKTVRSDGVELDVLYADLSDRKWKESLPYNPGVGEAPHYLVYAYDGQGRMRTGTAPDGSQTHVNYASGPGWSTVQRLDALGHETMQWMSAAGKIVQTREEVGGGATHFYTTYAYDTLNRILSVTDQNGRSTTHTYNSLGWELSNCDMDLGCTTMGYDPTGHVVSRTDANGNTVNETFDAAGRRTERLYPGGTAVLWNYDEGGHGAGAGRLTSWSDASGSESYVYDPTGRILSSTKCVLGACYTMTTAYDPTKNRPASVTYPTGEVVSYGYDAAGRLQSLSGYVTAMTYNSADRPLLMAYANGTTNTYTYDANRLWLDTATVTASGSTLYQANYSYDVDARVTSTSSSTDSSLNVSYSYDDLHRLLSVSGAQSQSFTYDATGNILGNSALGSYAYGDARHAHAATAAGGNAYTYDANGNMLTASGATSRTFTWSYDNQPLTVSTSGGTTSFLYDGMGSRVRKSGPSGTHSYFGPSIEIENGHLVTYYHAGRTLVAKQDASGKYWYHQDHLGSIRLITDESGDSIGWGEGSGEGEGTGGTQASSTAPVARMAYAPFGAALAGSTSLVDGAGVTDSFGFGGHRTDPEVGLVYMNARSYDATLGRFISADSILPSDSPQALNRYSFAYNNPVSNTDPTGHLPAVAILVAVGISAATASTIVTVVAVVGVAMTIAGMALHNPILLSIGQVMVGFASGGAIGLAVAALTSPVSPLSPGVKQIIGWAYMAANIISDVVEAGWGAASQNPAPPADWKPIPPDQVAAAATNAGVTVPANVTCTGCGLFVTPAGKLGIINDGIFSGVHGVGFFAGLQKFVYNLGTTIEGMFTEMPQTEALDQISQNLGLNGLDFSFAESMGSAIAVNAAEYVPDVTTGTLNSVPITSLISLATGSLAPGSSISGISLVENDPISGWIFGPMVGAASGIPVTTNPSVFGFLVGPHVAGSFPNP